MISIIKKPWTSDTDDKFKISGAGDLHIIRDQVKNGIAELWHCKSKKSEGWAVTRVDEPNEFCLVLGEGSGIKEFVPYFVKYAHKMGLDLRVHVQRRGMIRIMQSMGFELNEYVLRCKK
ncbi:hypothetical protein [Agarilytica rhodophyticola]|uniref:hypothetical protein n=1 Tax=Agarilytica rhodophyticola TaxID=1737490 RepID=UPI000B34452D|nr:hypothetical protein [Agarilytica rhodophyticola]